MILLIKNAEVYSPGYLGRNDILIGGEKILAVEKSIDLNSSLINQIDALGKIVTPGFIDQHVHITGAGGKNGFSSMTPEISSAELIRCGITSVVGLLGTDFITKSLPGLFAKVKSLEQEGVSAYMLTGSFNYPTNTLFKSVLEDIIFIDKVIGCKTAISDERSAFPTENELLRLLREINVGGMITGKGGILHIHVGALESGLEMIIDLAGKYPFLVPHLSPTHVGRTENLFLQAIEFAKMGGMIDISTGGTKFDLPYKQVLYALEKGVSIDRITFSSDGNAGMAKKCSDGEVEIYKAPIDLNLKQVILLIHDAGFSIGDALKLITSNPAKNLSLKQKGHILPGFDADLCFLTPDLKLTDVISKGNIMMKDETLIKGGSYEKK